MQARYFKTLYHLASLDFCFICHIWLKNFWDNNVLVMCLIVLDNGRQQSRESKSRGVISMNKLYFIIGPAQTCSKRPSLIVSHIVSSMGFAVLPLPGKPNFNINATGVGFTNISRTFLQV